MPRWNLFVLVVAASLASGTPLFAQTPDSLDELRKQIQVLRIQKDFTRQELVKLLATTPQSPYYCPTGELWPAFEAGAQHPERTVRVLLDLYRAQKDRWKRYHLLTALSRERHPALREFWLKLLADPNLPADYRWPVVSGVGRCGTDRDVTDLARRLGTHSQWDNAILFVLSERPQPGARPALLARFRDRKATDGVRTGALRVLVRLGGAEVAGYLREAARDESEAVRKAGVTLKKQLRSLQQRVGDFHCAELRSNHRHRLLAGCAGSVVLKTKA